MKVRPLARHVVAVAFVMGVVSTSCGSSPLAPESVGSQRRSDAAAQLTVTRMAPTSGPVGTQVTITGSGFAARGNTVKFGSGYIKGLDSADGTTLQFAIPEGLDLCAPDGQGPCAGAYPRVRPGEYVVAVMVGGDTRTTATFSVTPQ